jgi:hypothetical protein
MMMPLFMDSAKFPVVRTLTSDASSLSALTNDCEIVVANNKVAVANPEMNFILL